TFSFPQPIGTGIPWTSGSHRAAYTASSDATAAFAGSLPPPHPQLIPPPQAAERVGAWESSEESDREFPEINRSLKGPRLGPRVRPDFDSPQPSTIDGLTPSSGLQSVAPSAPPSSANEEPAADRAPEPTKPAPADADVTYLDPETAEPWLVDGKDA